MPTIRPYLSRENAYTGGIQSRATPSAFGSDIGAGLEGLGSAIGAVAPILKQKANEAAADQAAAAVSTYDYSKRMIEERQAAGANPTGLADNVKIWHPTDVEAWLKGRNLSGPAYRRAYRQLMGQQESIVTQQRNYEIQQTDANGQRLANEGINSIQNQIFSNPDAYDDLIPKMNQQIDLQRNIDPGQREQMKIAGRQDLALNRFKAKISDTDTVEGLSAIEKELTSDPWTQRVDAKDTNNLLGIIKVQKNSIQTLADSEALAGVNGIKERVEKGQPVPPEEMQRVHALAVKAGNKSIDNKLAILDIKTQTTNTYGNVPTAIIQHDLNAERARATGGGQVIEETAGKIRDMPISPTTRSFLQRAAAATGVEVVVTSGGQPASGPHRTGSHRHDLGGAADVKLRDSATGRFLNMQDPNDQQRFAQFVTEAAAAGATGIGAGRGYMGDFTIHVGGGTEATWGDAPWLKAAFEQGRGRPGAVVPPRYDFSAQLAYTGLRSRVVGYPGVVGDGTIQAAVLAGNIQQESSFRSWALNAHANANGLMQWRDVEGGMRFRNLREFAASKGKSWEDPNVQMDFIMHEGTTGVGLTPGQKAGFDQFLRATTMEEANAGLKKYIAYGEDGTEGKRLENARRIMNGYDQDASGQRVSDDPLSQAGTTEADFAKQEAMEALIKRNNDLITQGNIMTLWSMQSGQPLADISQPGGVEQRLQQAEAAAHHNSIPVQDMKPFTAEETAAIGKAVKDDQTGELTLQLMASLGNSEMGKAGAKQIGVNDPGFEYLAGLYAGGASGRDIASAAMAGRKVREQSKGTIISGGNDRDSDQNKALEQVFVANAGKSLDLLRTDRNTVKEAAFDLFIDRYITRGKGTTEPGKLLWDDTTEAVYKQALQDVLGRQGGTPPIDKVNNEQTYMPDGVTGPVFDAMLDKLTPVDYMLASADNNPPRDIYAHLVPADEIANTGKFKLVEISPEHGPMYQIVMGDGNFLLSQPGKPYKFVFEKVRDKADQVTARLESPGYISSQYTAAKEQLSAEAKRLADQANEILKPLVAAPSETAAPAPLSPLDKSIADTIRSVTGEGGALDKLLRGK